MDVARQTGKQALKKLFLHIGHYKTGTSAIQDYLSSHADALRACGYLYPESARPKAGSTNHGHLSLSLARAYGFNPPPWYREDVTADDAYQALHDEIAQSAEEHVIVSSEEFVQLALVRNPEQAIRDLKERLAAYDVHIILYLREPFSLLKSWFNEVNKGPVGTRNFPTFFANLNQHFLSQERICKAYTDQFGPERMTLLTYKSSGADHIREFLRATGCGHEPMPDLTPVNPGQSLDTLEIARLSKDRRHSYAEATVTDVGGLDRFTRKVGRISRAYDRVAAQSDDPKPSRLSPEAIIHHYADLLTPARAITPLNQEEAINMRDLALEAEQAGNLPLAHAFMTVAQIIRPNGPLINEKLAQYNDALEGARNA